MTLNTPPFFLARFIEPIPDTEAQLNAANVSGALIFFAYIAIALLLIGGIVVTQLRSYSALCREKTRLTTSMNVRLLVRCGLALLSFAVLSWHMLAFLVDSYVEWRVRNGNGLRDVSGRVGKSGFTDLWQWASHTALFTQFANDVFGVKEAETVISLALTWEMVIAVWMTAVARESTNPNLWLYVFLAQILPISFIQNLIEIAALLDCGMSTTQTKSQNNLAGKETTRPQYDGTNWRGTLNSAFNIALSIVYGKLIRSLPLIKSTSLIIPGVLLTRVFLMVPCIMHLVFPSTEYATPSAAALATLINIIGQTMFSGVDGQGGRRAVFCSSPGHPAILSSVSLENNLDALQTNHAVGALGWDVVLGFLSWLICSLV